MPLAEYRRKRDFRKTSEPRGDVHPRKGWLYLVQKHDASHLHYDFRLQLGEVLKSWAVPKGPSLDPADKRLAIEVEDHPVEYGSFEGIIPEGEYGGGTVMLWDRGSWEPIEDPVAGYRAGRLKFNLHGEKLRGSWALVRSSRTAGSAKPQWFLIKHRDEEARDKADFDIALEEPLSVATGRDLEDIAADRDRVWGSSGEVAAPSNEKAKSAKTGGRRLRKPALSRQAGESAAHEKTTVTIQRGEAKPPQVIQPELATLVKAPPEGDDWLHEIKFDGYRIIAHADGQQVRFQTRNELDWTAKMPQLAEAVRRLKLRRTILDGEAIALDQNGVSQFQLLQNAFREKPGRIIYTVFDLLFFNGNDLRARPLAERKEILASLGLATDRGLVRYVEHVRGHGPEFLKAAEKQGLEGIICKRRDRPYIAGRTTDWLKCKTHQAGEFVIGAFTDPAGSRTDFGALLVGYHDRAGPLRYAGRVGTGFTAKSLADLKNRLKPLAQDHSPFADFPPRGGQPKGVHWVRPELVAQVEFSNWTEDLRMRHPSFQGLREDKPAEDVTMETPAATAKIAKPAKASNGRVAGQSRKEPSERKIPPRRVAPSSAAKMGSEPIVVEGVELTHPGKFFYPDDGITKRELAEYYVAVSEQMLPHVAGRPLSIVRCPDGINGQRFFQKHLGESAPKALHGISIREKSGAAVYSYVEDVAGLVALAQIAALEIHVWGCRADSIERPDQLIFDLDPAPELEWKQVVEAALEVRGFLRDLGLESFVKTSGGKGLHLVAPIQRRQPWAFVAEFCHRVAIAIEHAAPTRYVSNMSKKKRTDKVFVDYLRNQRGATAVAPFSTRTRPGAPVAMPISWRELPRTTGSMQFTLRDVVKRKLYARRDPWPGFFDARQTISAKTLKLLEF